MVYIEVTNKIIQKKPFVVLQLSLLIIKRI